MKNIFIVVVVFSILALSCNTSGSGTVKSRDKNESLRIDSLVNQIDSVKSEIDSAVKEVDRFIEDL